MKKIILLALVGVFAITLIACGGEKTSGDSANKPSAGEGHASSGAGSADSASVLAKAKVIDNGTELLVAGIDGSLGGIVTLNAEPGVVPEGIKAGDVIEITYNGIIGMSYPGFIGGASKVELVSSGDDLVGAYVNAISEFINTADGLAVQDGYCAVSMDEVSNLSDAERQAVVYMFPQKINTGIQAYSASIDELVADGRIINNEDGSKSFEDGFVLAVRSEIVGDSFRIQLDGWSNSAKIKQSDWIDVKFDNGIA